MPAIDDAKQRIQQIINATADTRIECARGVKELGYQPTVFIFDFRSKLVQELVINLQIATAGEVAGEIAKTKHIQRGRSYLPCVAIGARPDKTAALIEAIGPVKTFPMPSGHYASHIFSGLDDHQFITFQHNERLPVVPRKFTISVKMPEHGQHYPPQHMLNLIALSPDFDEFLN